MAIMIIGTSKKPVSMSKDEKSNKDARMAALNETETKAEDVASGGEEGGDLSPEEQTIVDETASKFELDPQKARDVFDYLWSEYKKMQ